MEVLKVESLSKDYGRIKALKGVSFSVPEGVVFGVLGPNGSGKTTLLGIIVDILKPTSGSFSLFGEKPEARHRKKIGTLLETPNFYHYLTGEQNLLINASIKGRGSNDIDRVLKLVNLDTRRHSKFSTYSLGMKQRLAIAAAMLGNPDILLFDEPTNGLDPVGIAEIRSLIKELHQQGKTIIMASHLLDEVEKVCTHVAVLKKGDLIVHGNVDEIFSTNDMVELAATNKSTLVSVLNSLSGIVNVKEEENGIVIASFPKGTADLANINKHCFENGVVLNKLNLKRQSLESKFFELTN
ncbi:MAG: ABC transporter ATP-binding protein [Ferruginibacter sp.]|nr:ABC transporter ATP-binding protein [Ferruginibacter sp.]